MLTCRVLVMSLGQVSLHGQGRKDTTEDAVSDMIDWERVLEMRGDVGDAEFRPILELFLDEIETVVFRLPGNDRAQTVADFHFLTGCARSLGFRRFSQVCEGLEALAERQALPQGYIDDALTVYADSKRLFVRDLDRMCRDNPAERDCDARVRSAVRQGSGHA